MEEKNNEVKGCTILHCMECNNTFSRGSQSGIKNGESDSEYQRRLKKAGWEYKLRSDGTTGWRCRRHA
jgi:hypothetical protein